MRNTRGFTLVEVLIAASILAVGLLAMISMFPTAYSNVDRSGEETVAATLAQQRIEWLRNQPFTSAALVAGTTTEALSGDYAGYTRRTEIQDNTPTNGVKQAKVRVDAPGGRWVALVSLIAR